MKSRTWMSLFAVLLLAGRALPAEPPAAHGDCAPHAVCDEDRLNARLGLRHDFGSGVAWDYNNDVAWDGGFSRINLWAPLRQSPGEGVLFSDTRFVLFDNSAIKEFNLGGGLRQISSCGNWLLGVNAYYDNRDTGAYTFHQAGVGIEALSDKLDFRANGYFAIDDDQRLRGVGLANPRLEGGNLVFDQVFNTETQLHGYDVEVGVPLPVLECFDPRVYVGYYYLSGPGLHEVHGIRGRIDAQINDNLWVQAQIQHDRTWDTTASIGVEYRFGGRGDRGGRRSVGQRLDTQVIRDVNVIVLGSGFDGGRLVIEPPPPPPPPPIVNGNLL